MRLFVLSCLLLIFFVPVVFYVFYTNINVDRIPYDWDLVHGEEWFEIERYPLGNRISFDRWIPIGTGLLMFLFFGLGKDALSMYKSWLCAIGLKNCAPTTLTSPKSSLRSSNSSGSGGSWFSRNKTKKNTADTTITQYSGTAV
jgi:pheromone a factor receptor